MVAKANLCATGVQYAKLNLLLEDTFFNKGVYHCAGASEVCFCKGKNVFIVGEGNSAGQAASYFSGFASKVYMIIRKGNLSETLADYLIKRIITISNIEVLYYSEVKELDGDEMLRRIRIANTQNNTEAWHDTISFLSALAESQIQNGQLKPQFAETKMDIYCFALLTYI